MNLYRLFNDIKKSEDYTVRSKLISELQGKSAFSEEEVAAVFAYKGLEFKSQAEVEKVTRKAFESRDLAERFRLLKRINGVTTLLASTLLMFQNQYRYAEINIKTWALLKREYGFKAPDKDIRSDYALNEYLEYLAMLSSIAAEYGMNLSDVEYIINLNA